MASDNRDGFVLAHDLGTTGDKAVLYSLSGNRVATDEHSYKTSYPQSGYAEQDPEAWWTAVCSSTKRLIDSSGVSPSAIRAVSFSAQMMGCLPVDKEGTPLRPAIIWADLRSEKEARILEHSVGMERVYRITGHRISSSYSATKLRWVKDHEPDVYRKTYKILQTKDFIIHRLTGAFVTDYSDACGTNLFDIEGRRWSEELADGIDIDINLLPEVLASTQQVGVVHGAAAEATGLNKGTPVILGGGDGVCAATGAAVIEPGSAYVVIGTSSWIATASTSPVYDPERRTFNWVHLDEKLYSPCGTMQSAGFSYSWLRNCAVELAETIGSQVGRDVDSSLSEAVRRTGPGADSLLFLPYLMGERSPRWNSEARGAFIGLGATHTGADMFRAVLEGVGFNLRVILDAFRASGSYGEIIAIGGGARNDIWLQILADIWNVRILVPRYVEDATSLGAALCGAVGSGAVKSFSVAKEFNPIVRTIEPDPVRHESYERLYPVFNEAYESLCNVFTRLGEVRTAQ